MGKIILGTDEVKKIYLGSQDANKIYLGNVEILSASNARVPAWFPGNNDPVQKLYSYWPTDMSQHFVDICVKNTSGAYCAYLRCYCDRDNSLQIYCPNGIQLFVAYTVNGSKVACREIDYREDGAEFTHTYQNWSQYNLLLSNNFVQSEVYIIEQGNAYTTNMIFTPHIIPQE